MSTTLTRRMQGVYGQNSYTDIMTYLHSIHITPEVKETVGRRLVQEVTEPALANAFEKIEHLATLRNGWAGKGSYAISPNVLKNLRQVLLISDNADWTEWTISPDVNATVGLQSKSSQALISLGVKEFSYYSDKDGNEQGDSHVAFTPETFLSVMRLIA